MGSRMDKYNNNSDIPKRSDKNKELYRQIYNAYDEFENLVVPSNAKEIDLSTLKREITSRDEYKKVKDYSDITNNKIVRKEKVIVCMKTPQGLSEEELKAVFADIKKQSLEDPILKAMLKAREAELKYKAQEKQQNEQETVINSDSKL